MHFLKGTRLRDEIQIFREKNPCLLLAHGLNSCFYWSIALVRKLYLGAADNFLDYTLIEKKMYKLFVSVVK
jgi:hypothetical protein